MTFDEAIEELRLAIPEKFYSPTMHDVAVMLEAQTKVINLLREEYAPTVEMTEEQKDIIMNLLDDSDISQDDWKTMINDDSPELPKISYRQAIMAYMNPETIKIVDE